ncbi:MAG: CotH kinase family protein [Phycisphaerales bacterium]|nr:CotH kinase family protein [Planctomycetota bacterium]MCH8507591.1 CotH kinase family protein [Phycisphaerales bacterium]
MVFAQPNVAITEWMYAGSTPVGGEFIEFTNIGTEPVDMTGWSFDDDARQPGAFDLSGFGVVMPGESVVLTEDPAEVFRADWGLGPEVRIVGDLGLKSGNNIGRNDEINLYDAQGELVDRLTYGDQDFPGSIRTRWISGNPALAGALGANDPYQWVYAEAGDLQGSWQSAAGDWGNPGVFVMPPSGELPGPVTVSKAGGFYTEAFTVELDATGDGIRYTLDGSVPTLDSPLYTGPILIENRAGDPNYFSLIRTSPVWIPPNGTVNKGTVLRAAAVNNDGQTGPVATRTFFVDPAGADRYTLPVVSVVTEERNFYDYEYGISVPGAIYDQFFDPDIPWWRREGNYTQRGVEWERPGHLEFFEPDGSLGFAQDVGYRIHGGTSRSYPRKSLRVYARSDYGVSSIQYPVFPGDAQTEFKRLIIRNSGNDHERTLFRDAFIQDLVKDTGVATQLYRPVVVFVNGEYWGVQNIRQRYDKHFLALRKGADPDNIDLLTGGQAIADEGDNTHFLETYQHLLDNDPSDPAVYEYAASRIDLENFATYYSIQMFIANSDWPTNNIDFWRPRTENGRWRWLLYDTDLAFNHGANHVPSTNAADRILKQLVTRNARILQRMLMNERFRDDFMNRSADLMNAELSVENMTARLADFRTDYAPEIPEHILRWRQPVSFQEWDTTLLGRIQTFIDQRANFHRQQLAEAVGLPGIAALTVSMLHPDRGDIRVSAIDLPSDEASWSGVYFQTIPVPIVGTPAPGYRFHGFEELPDAPDAEGRVIWVPDGDQTLTARFACLADFDGNGVVNFFDISAYLQAFAAGDPAADLAEPFGELNFFDLAAYLQLFNAGCP